MNNLEVKFCLKCVESNQRFLGSVTHEDKKTNFKEEHCLMKTRFALLACIMIIKKKLIGMRERKNL